MSKNVLVMINSLCPEMKKMFRCRTQIRESNSDIDLTACGMDTKTNFVIGCRAAAIYMRDNQDIAYKYLAKILAYAIAPDRDDNCDCYGLNAAVFSLFSELNSRDVILVVRMALFALFATVPHDKVMHNLTTKGSLLAFIKAKCDEARDDNVYAFDVLPLYYCSEDRVSEPTNRGWTWTMLLLELKKYCAQNAEDSIIYQIVSELPDNLEQ